MYRYTLLALLLATMMPAYAVQPNHGGGSSNDSHAYGAGIGIGIGGGAELEAEDSFNPEADAEADAYSESDADADADADASAYGKSDVDFESDIDFEINDELLDIENGLVNGSGNSESDSEARAEIGDLDLAGGDSDADADAESYIEDSGNSASFSGSASYGEQETEVETDVEQELDADQSTEVAQGQAQSTDQEQRSTNVMDNIGNDYSTNTQTISHNYKYRAPILDSQVLLMNSNPCTTFLGIQFSGANKDGAAATGLGLPIRDRDCKLDKATRLAFGTGNIETGWTLFCRQSDVAASYRHILKLEGVKGRRARAQQAHEQCYTHGMRASLVDLRAKVLDMEMHLNELGQPYDDSEVRARLASLEEAAHRPDSKELHLHPDH